MFYQSSSVVACTQASEQESRTPAWPGRIHRARPVWYRINYVLINYVPGSLSGDIGFRPGTRRGFGADSAVACVLSQGDLRLRAAIVRPFGRTHVRLQDERRVRLASLGPICDGAWSGSSLDTCIHVYMYIIFIYNPYIVPPYIYACIEIYVYVDNRGILNECRRCPWYWMINSMS